MLLTERARSCLFLLFLWAGCGAAQAAIDAYPFPDETMQARYETLIAELRCPQCLNTNLAGSDAMIAQALRGEVHQMLIAGKSDDQVRQYLRERYGDFILYRPRWTAGTLLLWTGPLLLLLIAALVLWRMTAARSSPPPLDAQETARIQTLLAEDDQA